MGQAIVRSSLRDGASGMTVLPFALIKGASEAVGVGPRFEDVGAVGDAVEQRVRRQLELPTSCLTGECHCGGRCCLTGIVTHLGFTSHVAACWSCALRDPCVNDDTRATHVDARDWPTPVSMPRQAIRNGGGDLNSLGQA